MKSIAASFLLFLLVSMTLFQHKCSARQAAGDNPCPIKADIWVLAGQSNMAGNGRTPDTTTSPRIWMLNLDNHWMIARNPLHRVYQASAFAYEKDMYELLPKSQRNWKRFRQKYERLRKLSEKKPIGRVGPGLYFAEDIIRNTDRSVGLIPCALGGSTINQWDPSKKSLGDSSLYGAMMNRISSVGEKIKGLVWYQGESEAMLRQTKDYEKKFLRLIDSFRKDVGNPNLPVIYVQIGKFNIRDSAMSRSWEKIREIQREVLSKRKNVYMVTGIDQPLDDCIHLSTKGQKTLGKRIGEMALTYVYKIPGHARQINVESMKLCKDKASGSYYVLVHYSGVCGRLTCCGLPSSFTLRMDGKENIEYVVSKAILDPDDNAGVDVYLSALPDVPAQLISGAGTYPYMNITDSLDNALPAFGPINIPMKLGAVTHCAED